MLGIMAGPASVVTQKFWNHGESAYSPEDPGDMLASLQEIASRVKKMPPMDTLELTRHEISQLTNKPEWMFRRSGYLGEDRPNPFKGGLDRGPNHPMFMFFIDQFEEIAAVDGDPDAISPNDLTQVHPELDKQPESFWERLPHDAGKLAGIFQLLLTRAGKTNGELTPEDLRQAGTPSRLRTLFSSSYAAQNAEAEKYADILGNEFNIIAAVDGDAQTLSIYDLVTRNERCPEVRQAVYPFRMRITGRTGPRPGY